jgi:hypothetical protein
MVGKLAQEHGQKPAKQKLIFLLARKITLKKAPEK